MRLRVPSETARGMTTRGAGHPRVARITDRAHCFGSGLSVVCHRFFIYCVIDAMPAEHMVRAIALVHGEMAHAAWHERGDRPACGNIGAGTAGRQRSVGTDRPCRGDLRGEPQLRQFLRQVSRRQRPGERSRQGDPDRSRRQALQVASRGDRQQPEAAGCRQALPRAVAQPSVRDQPVCLARRRYRRSDPCLLSGADADQRRRDEPLCPGLECQGPGDGLLRYLEDLSVEACAGSSRWAMRCSTRRSAVRSSITRSWSARARSGGRMHRRPSSRSWMRAATW